jgi:YggT family protein
MIADLIRMVFTIIYVAILARIILSFIIPLSGGNPHPILANVYAAVYQITEPVLAPIRRVLPTFGMFDFSPLVAIVLLQIIQTVLVSQLG